ncbi:MAG: type II secretion system F family protein, partial [Rhodopirellula sp.]|nr:type II secretion system F family protein [Rhodopirellula sp.]
MISSDIRVEFERFRNAGLNGDDMAASRLESRFGDGLTRFVRRIVRAGRGTGALAEFILNEASIIREQLGLERDELVAELNCRLCAVITGRGFAG